MEILTLIKANIRRKKGSFVSVILLTLIITMSVTTILSIKESASKGVNNAHEICDTSDLLVMYLSHNLTDDMVEKIKSDDRVKRVDIADSILTEKTTMGNEDSSNTIFITRYDENIRLLKSDLYGIAENTPELQKGGIYVPQGLLTVLHGKVGEKITLETLDGEHEFIVKGILLEPMMGASVNGFKILCISDEDFSEISSSVSEAETEDKHGLGKTLEIYKADDCTLTNGQFRRQLNLDTGVTNMSICSLTNDMSIHYTTLFPEIISSVLIVFVMFLLVIVVIVTGHSISVEIETNYVTFGVLKAQGFNKNKIRMLFLYQYLLAEMIGAVLGISLSIPLIKLTSNIFVTITAIPAITSVPAGIIALILATLFLLSAVSIFFVTMKINKISPVRAISGAKKEIYFDSRMNVPISKKFLSPSLALRQFTSAKRRYAGTLVIVAILIFFMMTITQLANALNSKLALESMGAIVSEVDISPKEKLSDNDYKMIENEIERFSKIKKAYYVDASYFSFDGEEMYCTTYKDPSVTPVLKGRSPIYDNEIAVSPILLDEFNLKIGDEVTIGWMDEKEKYIISGTVPLMNDTGRSFIMSYAASEKIGYDANLWGCYSLENGDDESLNAKIADTLNEKFGDIIEAEVSGELLDDTYDIAINAMQMIIYVFSVMFAFVVTHMVCSKAFIQERTDIGIYKAIGFTSKHLRFQFAVRFLIVSVLGSAVGAVLSVLFSGKLLSGLLRSIGITRFVVDFTAFSFAAPIALICVSFFVFAYLVSRKIKNVAVKELVVE
ncbi:MAG: ABC transporter permease [Ruminococcus sp.]|nr:ABC transporter permease [Ruminococcus sp.]MDE6849608.1 ABC transporter permease [Ruminococcus sp.]MDE7137169.1 ABC transporter permease [Ruminococcus sp.]